MDSVSSSGTENDETLVITMQVHLETLLDHVTQRVISQLDTPSKHRTPWLTLPEACEYLRWPKHRLYKLTAARAIPHVKHDGRLLFNRTDLDAWLAGYHLGPHS